MNTTGNAVDRVRILMGVILVGAACVAAWAAPKSPGVSTVEKTGAIVTVPSAEHVLDTLRKPHPRLLLTDERLAGLKGLAERDEVLQGFVRNVLTTADKQLRRSVLKHDLRGPRLLSVSRKMVSRSHNLGLAWRWTGKKKYRDKLLENLLAVCAFKDWNPSHFLDTAEMSYAVGIGYDWLYNDIDEPTRRKIRGGLIRNGLALGVSAYEGAGHGWWVRSKHNWNQVCSFGLTVGALAVAETDPEYAQKIIPSAVREVVKALKTYAPDGAWPEGPGYWGYATRYTVYGLAAMETALGTDFGLSTVQGLDGAGDFPIYAQGPTGLYLNFADSGERSRRRPQPSLFWLGGRYKRQFFINDEHNVVARSGGGGACHVLWYQPATNERVEPSLDKHFGGPVEVAVFRGAWGDPNAMFVGVKAGYNQVGHAQLDLGNFELDALGVRWARDLGSDNYNMPGYWDKGRGGKRWTYYRMRSVSHNVCVLGGRDQDVMATSKMVKFRSDAGGGCAVVDLTEAYKDFASKSVRGVALTAGRAAVLVQDEFDIVKPCEVAWGMTTDAKIEVLPGGKAVLTIDGKRLEARILAPAGAAFSVESARQKRPEKANKGVSRLMIRLGEQKKGPLRIAVLLLPARGADKVAGQVSLKPLKQW